jgi:hypothetical protein
LIFSQKKIIFYKILLQSFFVALLSIDVGSPEICLFETIGQDLLAFVSREMERRDIN